MKRTTPYTIETFRENRREYGLKAALKEDVYQTYRNVADEAVEAVGNVALCMVAPFAIAIAGGAMIRESLRKRSLEKKVSSK